MTASRLLTFLHLRSTTNRRFLLRPFALIVIHRRTDKIFQRTLPLWALATAINPSRDEFRLTPRP